MHCGALHYIARGRFRRRANSVCAVHPKSGPRTCQCMSLRCSSICCHTNSIHVTPPHCNSFATHVLQLQNTPLRHAFHVNSLSSMRIPFQSKLRQFIARRSRRTALRCIRTQCAFMVNALPCIAMHCNALAWHLAPGLVADPFRSIARPCIACPVTPWHVIPCQVAPAPCICVHAIASPCPVPACASFPY